MLVFVEQHGTKKLELLAGSIVKCLEIILWNTSQTYIRIVVEKQKKRIIGRETEVEWGGVSNTRKHINNLDCKLETVYRLLKKYRRKKSEKNTCIEEKNKKTMGNMNRRWDRKDECESK